MKTLYATVKIRDNQKTFEWELLKTDVSSYLVIARTRDDVPLVIKIDAKNIYSQDMGMGIKANGYKGVLDISDAFLLKRA